MSTPRVHVGPGDSIHISVDEQHISRITRREARDIILQLLVFGGSELREEVIDWLSGDAPVSKIAEYLADGSHSARGGLK